ncbi:MAG: ABC transporter substrate-binding protein, partial [Lachnospiraceae bacterium]|nr:ABC transporter substrate-binding protein [Lachnospiraceae bacterium]
MKGFVRKLLSLSMAAALVLITAGCGSGGQDAGTEDGNSAAGQSIAAGEKIVNVGVTDSLGGVNPFVIDQTEINKYAVGLMFLPLVELDSELNFQGMLADSVTTEDNLNFVVHIDDAATWSDGTPVTAADVEYTVRRLASPVVNNTTLMLYAFEGVGDDGFVEKEAESVSGLQIIDEK